MVAYRSLRPIAFLCIAFSVLSLGGCGLFTHHHVSVKKHPVASSNADSYLLNLAKTQLAFEYPPVTLAALKPIITPMNAYAKTQEEKDNVRVLLLTYNTKHNKQVRTLMLPLFSGKNRQKFVALQQVSETLAAHQPQFNAIHVGIITLDAQSLPLQHVAIDDLEYAVETISHDTQATLAALPPREEAQIQLELAQFFTQHRIRDAAYLALDYTKTILSTIDPATPEEAVQMKSFSHAVDAAENTLHQTLPYTF